jgi:hypothetical protein
MEELLRWRLARAEAEAPRPPRAARLLEEARPWWEIWPARFQDAVERLSAIRLAVGHAMAEPRPGRIPVRTAALVLRKEQEIETSVRVLYLRVEGARLRLRFELEGTEEDARKSYDVTFVCTETLKPLFSAPAQSSLMGEYSIDFEMSPELARTWEHLKVMDRMPFRLILRSDTGQ